MFTSVHFCILFFCPDKKYAYKNHNISQIMHSVTYDHKCTDTLKISYLYFKKLFLNPISSYRCHNYWSQNVTSKGRNLLKSKRGGGILVEPVYIIIIAFVLIITFIKIKRYIEDIGKHLIFGSITEGGP